MENNTENMAAVSLTLWLIWSPFVQIQPFHIQRGEAVTGEERLHRLYVMSLLCSCACAGAWATVPWQSTPLPNVCVLTESRPTQKHQTQTIIWGIY